MKRAKLDALVRAAPWFFRCRGAVDASTQAASIAASLGAISSGQRDEMLRRAVNRERVELSLELVAYAQSKGKRNRNSIRFSEGAIGPMAATGIGTPFLRDHEQGDSRARGGTITASTGSAARGAAEVRQSVLLADPPAVERALRGLLDSVSIGFRPTGTIMCTACNAEIFELAECWDEFHVPGAELDDGKVVEWEYTAAELVETSEISVPAVPEARIESIREAIAGALGLSISRSARRAPPVLARPAPAASDCHGPHYAPPVTRDPHYAPPVRRDTPLRAIPITNVPSDRGGTGTIGDGEMWQRLGTRR